MALLPFLPLILGLLVLSAPATAQRPPLAYVSNNLSRTLSVIDTGTRTLIATIPLPATPRKLAVSADGALAYVTARAPDSVLVVDLATGTTINEITDASFNAPEGIALSPSRR